jgi:hypothetical protein
MKSWWSWWGVVALTLLAACSARQPGPVSPQDGEAVQRVFGGTYDTLTPEQRRLVDDWFRRFSDVIGRDVPPDVGFNLVRLSTRTTLDAVTNALMRSELTDESGRSLGTALDLVQEIESVAGKRSGASGDRQFRMYVVLKPDALQTLKNSREFKRGRDNTVYHKGYPINYRQHPTVPSIQISVAKNGRHADIDVDYRSSKFPQALFNGHLTAANSDVRAGNNHQRHVSRWEGLTNWWRGLFGLPLSSDYSDESGGGFLIPDVPRAGTGRIEEAVTDFMRAWLVEGEVEQALAYVSDQAEACFVPDAEEQGDGFNRGMIKPMLMMRMRDIAEILGPASSLDDVSVGVRLVDPSLRVVRQPHHSNFVLYNVSDQRAKSFLCEERSKLDKQRLLKQVPRFSSYYGSVFYLYKQGLRGATVALLWKKVDGYWKIVSYEVEPEASQDGAAPDLRSKPEPVTIRRTEGDERLITSVHEFLQSWLVDKQYEYAFSFMSPRSYACFNLFREPGEPKADSFERAGRLMLEAMRELGEQLGPLDSLETVIAAVQPQNPDLLLVSHPGDDAYTVMAVPDHVASGIDCQRIVDGLEPDESAGVPRYGHYYGTAMRFNLQAGESPVLALLWAREETGWKIVSYLIEEP